MYSTEILRSTKRFWLRELSVKFLLFNVHVAKGEQCVDCIILTLLLFAIADTVAYILQQAKLEKYNTDDLIVRQGDVGEM